jgi:hypothetical protein
VYQKAQTQKHAARQTPVPSHALSVTGNGFGFRILNTPARKSDGRDAQHRIRDHARGPLDPMGLVAGMPRLGSSEESMPLTVAETGRFGRDPERGGAGGETTCDETRSRSKVPFAAVCARRGFRGGVRYRRGWVFWGRFRGARVASGSQAHGDQRGGSPRGGAIGWALSRGGAVGTCRDDGE